MTPLEDRLLAAHQAGDTAALITLYSEAADLAEGAGDVDRACFFLTHAYVFALQLGDPRANGLNHRLATHGRDPRIEGL